MRATGFFPRRPRLCRQLVGLALLLLFALVCAPALADAVPARPDGAVMVPERFLRAWDPVTIFFDEDRGPAEGGLETEPERHVHLTPEHPGVYRWLDARTLQFRPVDPWPALAGIRWQVGDHRRTLSTLIAPAILSLPADGAANLPPVDTIILGFREPVAEDDLARMIRVDVYRQPGIDAEPLRTLGSEAFSLQALERADRAAPARYRLRLQDPVGEGMRAVVRLRLSLDDAAEQAFQTIDFRTRRPFRPVSFGCPQSLRAVTQEGTAYPAEDVTLCRQEHRSLDVHFTEEPAPVDPVQGRNLMSFEPAVDGLSYRVAGNRLRVSGDFRSDTVYRMTVTPAGLEDVHGRPLELGGASSLHFAFPAPQDFLSGNGGEGRVLMERHGPRMLPLRGRGDSRVDLRIHAVDPEDLDFWPYVDSPVVVSDDARPPGPGEEPGARAQLRMDPQALAARIHALGSPSVSELVRLPLGDHQGVARFGLDLSGHLDRIAGEGRPGTYLVGLRRLDDSDQRHWVRLQVTDLSLTVVEEERQIRFMVTSLRSGEPVAGARVRVDAGDARRQPGQLLVNRADGLTDRSGAYVWQPRPGRGELPPERIVVTHGDDTLVVDVRSSPPERYFRGNLAREGGWLQWVASPAALAGRPESPDWRGHLYTERPVYRPDEAMHMAGYLRQVHRGKIENRPNRVSLVVTGPDGSEWRYRPELDDHGGFYSLFDEHTQATGEYRITASYGSEQRLQPCGTVRVERTAYRIPRFEVRLDGPARTPMDRPFQVRLDAEYYAGGMVRERPVRWRVTQFPYRWQPRGRDGYLFSSDARYSGMARFESRPALSEEGRTDGDGVAALAVDPTREPTAQPRRYVFEATVVGDDDQTVTDTLDVLALPPFVLGLKAPRYLERADTLDASVIMVGPDEELIAGEEITVRLIRRRWAARLQASDFTDGEPAYRTEVVDEPLAERTLTSAAEPLAFSLPLDDTGVYVLEVSARDALGRSQHVELDLFNNGESRATWPRPPAATFDVATERDRYAPGDTARFILQSPMAAASVLAMVERPDGSNSYHWLAVENGKAVFELPVTRDFMPGVPVHFVLMRGRLEGAGPVDRHGLDLGKPVTMAATATVTVADDDHRLEVALEYPAQTRPGEDVTLRIRLSDREGRPLAGRVSLWLVDQAVLALGEEQPLDPLRDFIRERPVRTAIRDTRNRAVGTLPFLTEPGGDAAARMDSAQQILDGLTVRERFESVPYFEHGIAVGTDGTASVTITLPDDLTNFMLRAKAVAGPDRFGHGTGRMAVRLPVIVQPSLPRFLRYGDRFTLSATSRVVDGESGAGEAVLELRGLEAGSAAEQQFRWPGTGAHRIEYPVSVPMPEHGPQAPSRRPDVGITVGVRRQSDGAGDAFSVNLPLYPDREAVRTVLSRRLGPGETLALDGIDEPVRERSLQRSLLLSRQAGVLETAAGLNYLLHYPHGCAEQRISRARALLAARELLSLLYPEQGTALLDHHVNGTLAYLADAAAEDGSIGFWPGARHGNVAVTAWALHLMIEAEAAGFTVDPVLRQRVKNALRRGLRGGHGRYYSRYLERTMALTALAADGELDSGYAAELARRTQFLDTESSARVTRALASESNPGQAMLQRLNEMLWGSLIFRLHDGEEIYAGLREQATDRSPVILPSETRTIAQVLQAVQASGGAAEREQALVDILVQLGRGNGWGTTNSNAEAIVALSESLTRIDPAGADVTVVIAQEDGQRRQRLGSEAPLLRLPLEHGGPLQLSQDGDQPLGVLLRQSHVPAAPGSQAASHARGFAVDRRLVRVVRDRERVVALDSPGRVVDFAVGEVVEDRLTLVNPEERHHVAVVMPLAAGMEPLNPTLETAPPEATPSRPLSRPPDYVAYHDHQVAFYYETLPAGSYDFAFRLRAQIPGQYTQPPALAELMYQEAVRGQSHGAAIQIIREQVESDGAESR
ncbi:MAG: hypothetical protein LAT50_05715 [Ectothiorhodospiraceae bacterium]|nr:hypothetical protein [Ectothiorhodospiraceae bacterium]